MTCLSAGNCHLSGHCGPPTPAVGVHGLRCLGVLARRAARFRQAGLTRAAGADCGPGPSPHLLLLGAGFPKTWRGPTWPVCTSAEGLQSRL